MTELVHYQETLEARRIRLQSNSIKTEGTLCSNGNYYAKTTYIKPNVTCSECKKRLRHT